MNRSCALTLSLLIACTLALAEDSERGRLADGRAFRTDPQGNQLVDYIAELELSVETLNRRITGLETELKEKESVVARLESGQGAQGELSEKDLLAFKSTQPAQANECPKVDTSWQCDIDTELKVKEVKDRYAAETQALRTRVAQLESASYAASAAAKAANNDDAELQAEVRNLKALLAEKESALDAQKKQVSALTAELKQARNTNEQARRSAIAAEEELQKERERLLEDKQELERKASQAQAQLSTTEAQYASLRESQNLAAYRQRAVDDIRSRVLAQVEEVRKMIIERDRLFAAHGNQGPVRLNPSKPVTGRNRTLDQISSDAEAAITVSQLAQPSRDVQEIRSRVYSDILAVQRVQRLQAR